MTDESHEYSWPVRALGALLAACVIPFALCLWALSALGQLARDVYTVADRIVSRLLTRIERTYQSITRRS